MKKIVIVSAFVMSFSLYPVPFFERSLFDINFRSYLQRVKKHELLVIPYFGFSGQGRNFNGDHVNPLQYLQPYQDALAMLKGFSDSSIESQIAQQVNVYDDNGTRGHYVVNGKFGFDFAVLSYSYHLFHEWFIRARIPVIAAHMSHTSWVDETQNLTYDDFITHQLITDQFFANVQSWGNLSLTDWSAKGFGDLTTYMHWERVFLQEKEYLKEVSVNARIGVSIPTSKRKDEDKAFSLPFGNDGAWSLPFGAGIDLKFKKFLRAGVDVAFENIFTHTKNRRIMTDPAQTDFLFLQKAVSRKEYGITQMFNLYLEPQLSQKTALRVAYQHTKHANDRLYIVGNECSSLVANQAAGLKEWTNHSVLIQLRYDNQGTRGLVSPIVSLFAQIPFNGKRSLNEPTVGFDVVLHF